MSKPICFLLALLCGVSFTLEGHGQSVGAQGTAPKGNSDPVYRQLRQKSNSLDAFSGRVATVNGLVLRREAATLSSRAVKSYPR